MSEAQQSFSHELSKLRFDCEEKVQLLENRNKELLSKTRELQEQVCTLEEEKIRREARLKQELSDVLEKLSTSEASLEVNTQCLNNIEKENKQILRNVASLKKELSGCENHIAQTEKQYTTMKISFEDKQKECSIAMQSLQEAQSTLAASAVTIKQLEETVQRQEMENTQLKTTVEALEKMHLQSRNMPLEEQLGSEEQKQRIMSLADQKYQALWEREQKTSSKLGLRVSELEKEKEELTCKQKK
ncbi:hypothetical protein WMY93_021761 [Mugilogobius chulae]|uniref:CCDC144C-like coiled-coil domain-containing protein n=1 Tax=Mugilogobius chulae TaxID=88201 RepID=A0AAW0NFX1_9GOBI